MSKPIPTIEMINKRRRDNRISALELYTRAGIAHRTWFDAVSGKIQSNIRTLKKFDDALDELIGEKEAAQ